jgi:hypothetical protein
MVEKVRSFHGKVLHIPGYDKATTRLFLMNKDRENITLSYTRYFFNGNKISYLTILHSFSNRLPGAEKPLPLLQNVPQEKLWGPPSLLFSGYQNSLLQVNKVCEVISI